MKINKVNQLSTNNNTVNKGNQSEKVSSSKSEGVDDQQSNVHLSPTFSNLSDTSAMNISKIAEIKQAMTEGRFKINPEVVADRLLETVKELIQNNKKV